MTTMTTISTETAAAVRTTVEETGRTVIMFDGAATVTTEAHGGTHMTITTAETTGRITINGKLATAASASPANANAVPKGRSSAWMQGYADGQSGKYDERLAEREECMEDYADGYGEGRKSHRA